jgi:hypothetical protein
MITYTAKMVSFVSKYVLPTMEMGKYLLPIKLAILRLWVNAIYPGDMGQKRVRTSALGPDCGCFCRQQVRIVGKT